MTDLALRDCVILVLEDEYLLAQELCDALIDRGAVVLGPAASVAKGLALIQKADRLNGAILDIHLRGEPNFSLADDLLARNVPFVFSTGYDASMIPHRFTHVARCDKAVRMSHVVDALCLATSA